MSSLCSITKSETWRNILFSSVCFSGLNSSHDKRTCARCTSTTGLTLYKIALASYIESGCSGEKWLLFHFLYSWKLRTLYCFSVHQYASLSDWWKLMVKNSIQDKSWYFTHLDFFFFFFAESALDLSNEVLVLSFMLNVSSGYLYCRKTL